MPPVIAAIGVAVEAVETEVAIGLISAGVPVGTSLAIAGAVPGIIVGGALVGLDLLLNRPPKPQAQATPIKTPIPPRVSGYGRFKLSGAYMLYEAPSASWLGVLAVHDGQIDGWERYFFHDDEVDIDGSGFVNPGPTFPKGDKYNQRGHGPNGTFETTLGQTPGPGFPDLVGYCNSFAPGMWTSNHRGDGIAAFYIRAAAVGIQHQNAVWPSGIPNASASGRLQTLYDPRQNGLTSQGDPSRWLWSNNAALALLHYLVNQPSGPQLDFATLLPNIADWLHAADVCDETVFRKYGVAHTTSQPYISVGDTLCSLADGANGIAQGMIATLQPGDVISFAGENMTVASLGAGVGGPPGVHGWVVNFTSAFTLQHATNEVVAWQPAAHRLSEPRYRVGGAFSWDRDPIETIDQLLDAMDGWLATKGDGSLTLRAGEYYEPTVILTDPHVLDYDLVHFTPDEQAINEYRPTFTDPDRKFTEIDAGAWQDETDIAARGGVVRSTSLALPWSPSGSQSRRIAKARMQRNTAELRGQLVTTLYGMNALGERFVRLQISDNDALHSLVVEILKVQIDLARLNLTFDFVQVPDSLLGATPLYDWDSDTDELPAFFTAAGGHPVFGGLTAPTISAVTVVPVPATSDGVGSQLTLTVSNPPGDLAGAADFVVRTAPHGTTNWTQQTLTDITPGVSTTTLSTGFVPAGSTDVQVAYITGSGALSTWSATTTVNASQPNLPTPTVMTASEAITAPALINVWSSSGNARIRHADNSLGQRAHGFILTSVAMNGTVAVYFGGDMTGLAGLTPGDAWLGTAGAVVSTAPAATATEQVVGQVIDTAGDTLQFAPGDPVYPT